MVIGTGSLVLAALLALIMWASYRIVIRSGTKKTVRYLRIGVRAGFIAGFVISVFKIATKLVGNPEVQIQVQSNAPLWPSMPKDLHFTSNAIAHVVSGGFQYADVTVSGLSLSTRFTLACADAVFGVLILSLLWLVDRILKAVQQGFEIRTVGSKTIRLIALVTLFGGEVGSFLQSVASSLAATDLIGTTGGYSVPAQINNPFAPEFDLANSMIFGHVAPATYLNFSFTVWPVLVSVALVLLSEIVKKGREVQAISDGLV
jgi:hypothetical protein